MTPIASRLAMMTPRLAWFVERPMYRRRSERPYRTEQCIDRFAGDVTDDEHDPRTRITATAFERYGRMKEVLGALQHDRTALAFDVDDALDPQEVGPAQLTERLERRVQPIPGERFVEPQTKRADRGVVASESFLSARRAFSCGSRTCRAG